MNSPPDPSHSPPSIVTTSPVMKGAASETRKAARLVSSSCSPKRRSGMRAFASASTSGVGISADQAPSVGKGPGAMAFTRIPYVAHSTASERVIASTPAFPAADGTTKAEPVQAYVVTMLSTLPARRSIIRFPAASVAWKVPWSTVLTTASKPRGESSSVGARKLPAALLTRTSMAPKSRSISSTASSTASASRTSAARVKTRLPEGSISRAAAARRASVRPRMATRAPSPANRFAIESPSPEPPPVTSTTRPARRSSR